MASFVFVAGIVYSETPGRACQPNWTKAAPVREAQDLETAKESIVALHLKLGFKVVVEWTSPKKYGPMCSFYGILARCDQNGLSASQGRDRSVKFDFLAYGSRPRWVIASGNAFAIGGCAAHKLCQVYAIKQGLSVRANVRNVASPSHQARVVLEPARWQARMGPVRVARVVSRAPAHLAQLLLLSPWEAAGS